MDNSKKLDQFYTNKQVAFNCTNHLISLLRNNNIDINKLTFLEPSAGDGAFIESLVNNNINLKKIKACDIDPKAENILNYNFFETTKKILHIRCSNKNLVTIGNPPFGKRSSLAIDFFNHAATLSDTIAFIVPVQFNKWSVQSKLDKSFKLIYSENLKENSFIFKNKPYSVRCCFQVWTKLNFSEENIRLQSSPPTIHTDFDMWQYNNTKSTEKYFDFNWDFAVTRQGYYDYTQKHFKKDECNKKRQYIFFKAHSEKALYTLMQIDFEKLARKNTSVLGFGKADVVEEYIKLMEDITCPS